MLRLYSRRRLPHPWTHPMSAIMAIVLTGTAGFCCLHQVKSPDIGWTRKHEGMANVRWAYNRQFKLYSPTIDFTTLKKPTGKVFKVDDLLYKKRSDDH